MSMTYETIEHRVDGGVHTLVLDRPDRLNALTEKLVSEAVGVTEGIARDPNARVLVVTGRGRGFCAGSDVGALSDNIVSEDEGSPWGSDQIRVKVRDRFQPLIRAVYEMPVPTIAAVRGPAVGGGMDLVCACDLAVASETARFMLAYVRRGLFPDLGGFWLLPRLVGYRTAVELFFTGRFVEADEALQLGLVNRVVPDTDLERVVEDLAREIAQGPPIALRLGKLLMQKTAAMDLRSALEFGAIATTITETSEDFRASVAAFLEGRDAVFRGR